MHEEPMVPIEVSALTGLMHRLTCVLDCVCPVQCVGLGLHCLKAVYDNVKAYIYQLQATKSRTDQLDQYDKRYHSLSAHR